jgi:hypothetical protein
MEKDAQEQLILDMTRLIRESIMYDMTLVVGGQCEDTHNKTVEFPVHKAILASRCNYFYNMFHSRMQEASSYTISIPDKHPDDMRVLLDYIYTSKLNIHPENAFGVLRLSDEYDMEFVKQHCITYVKQYITGENVFDILEESVFHNFIDLIHFCKTYVEQNASKLFFSDSFLKVSKQTLTNILKSDKIMLTEIEIFIAIIQWGKYQVKAQRFASNSNNLTKRKRTRTLLTVKALKSTGSSESRSIKVEDDAERATGIPMDITVQTDATGQIPIESQLQLSTSEKSSFGKSPSKRVKRPKQPSSLSERSDLPNSLLSLSEIDDMLATESEVTDSGFDDEEEEDSELPAEHNFEHNINLERTSPRQLHNLLNLTITSSASILEPSSHVTSSPTPFQPQDSTQLQKRFASLLDYTSDKNTVNALAQVVVDLMEFIRFPTLDPHEIYDFVEPSLVVPKNLLLEAYRSHALSRRSDVVKTPRMKVRDGSLFWYPGVLENVPIKLLKGWTCIYQQPYSHSTTESVINDTKGARILIAARHKNSSRLALCAMGRREDVVRETVENETTFENGVYFYHWKNRSIGFSPADDINLGTADLGNGSKKLSWHLTGRGGYRCGNLIRLNDSSEWEKLIFYAR